jgi:hypothetical protein
VSQSRPVDDQGHGAVDASGALFLDIVRRAFPLDETIESEYPGNPSFRDIARHGFPNDKLSESVKRWRTANCRRLIPQIGRLAVARGAQRVHGMPFVFGALWLKAIRGDGTVDDLGLASLRVVTTAGVTYICADIAGGANDSNLFKFHGFGTGTNAEASADTALQTELTTQYATDSTRPTGSQASSTNTYTTVATLSPDTGGTIAITEHGIFTAISAGTLLDRSVFSAVNLVAGADSLQATYVLTLPAGS